MRLFRQVTMNDELLKEFPFTRELVMQAYVLEHPEILKLDKIYDDPDIYEEEITIRGGRIDMIATYSGAHIAVIEFKNVGLVESHLAQLENYLEQKERLENLNPPIIPDGKNKNLGWIGILIGPSIDPELAYKISKGYSYNDIPIAAIIIERFRSAKTQNVYITTDTYFKNSLFSQDKTKYNFNGKTYGKGPLVLAVMQEHIAKNSNVTCEELRNTFPKNLSNNGIFATLEEANTTLQREGRKRHFINKGQVIKLGDGVMIAVSSQWSINNIGGFIAKANQLGYTITEAKK